MYRQHTFSLMIILAATVSSLYSNQFRQLQNDIGIVARCCKLDELLVDADGWQLRAADFMAKGFTPVRIYIENKRDRAVVISEHSTPVITDVDALSRQFKCREIGRPLGVIAACYGLTCMINAVLIYMLNEYHARGLDILRVHPDLAIAFMASLASSTCFLLSVLYSPFYWYRLREANKKLPEVLKKLIHPDPLIIPRCCNAEKIIFIYSSPGWSLVQKIFPLELFDEADGGSVAQFYISLDTRK